jgi:hemin uptake protein HemP
MYTPPRKSFGMTTVVEPRPARQPVDRDPRPVHDARALTSNGVDAEIVLDGQRYLLRITRQGKLILTK